MSSQCGELWHTNSWDWQVWGTPANFNGFCILASLLHRRRSTEVNQTLHDVWPSPELVHYIYIFLGCCPLTEYFQVQNLLFVQVLHYPILAALLHGIWAVDISETLWHGTRNAVKELLKRAPHIFGRSAIMLGISPHSSFLCNVNDLTCILHIRKAAERCKEIMFGI